MTIANSDFRRADGCVIDEMREATITCGLTDNPAGSALVAFGNTRVMCTASVEQSVL